MKKSRKTIARILIGLTSAVLGIAGAMAICYAKEQKVSGRDFFRGNTYDYENRFLGAFATLKDRGWDVIITDGVRNELVIDREIKNRVYDESGKAIFDFRITNFSKEELPNYDVHFVPGTYVTGDEGSRPVSSFILGKESCIAYLYSPTALFKSDYLARFEGLLSTVGNLTFSQAFDLNVMPQSMNNIRSFFASSFLGVKANIVKQRFSYDVRLVLLLSAFHIGLWALLMLIQKERSSLLWYSLGFSALLSCLIASFGYYAFNASLLLLFLLLSIISLPPAVLFLARKGGRI